MKKKLAKHLVDGNPISIINAFEDLGIKNVSKEIRRLIEIPFELECIRVEKIAFTKVGQKKFTQYELYRTKYNKKKFDNLKRFAYDKR